MPSKTVLFAICAIFLASSAFAANGSPDLVVNVFRHGARGPTKHTYDPNWDPSLYGQLTPAGERMQYLLGAALAKQYPEILGQPFSHDNVYARTSQSDRCVNSIESQLYGAYQGTGAGLGTNYPTDIAVPPFDAELVNQVLQGLNNNEAIPGGYVPIIINSVPTSDDIVLETPSTCPALYVDAVKYILSGKSRDFWYDSLSQTRATIEAAGFKMTTPFDMGELGDACECNYVQNRTLPANITYGSELFKNVTFVGSWYTVLAQYTAPQQKELLSVPLFAEVFQYLDARAANATSVEFVFLSTHDTALLTILTALDIVNEDCLMQNYLSDLQNETLPVPTCYYPPFASTILFEFYENAGSPYVILKYNDVAIPLCSANIECPYSDFKAFVQKANNNYTVEDYKLICLNGVVDDAKGWVGDAKHLVGDVKGLVGDVKDLVSEFQDFLKKF